MASDFEAQVRATNEAINARTGRPLLRAILVGLLLGGALLVSLLVIKELYMIFAAALIGFATYELATALRSTGRDVPRVPTIAAAIAIVPAAFYWQDAGHWLVTLAAIALVSLWRLAEMIRPSMRVSPAALLRDLGAGVFILVYIGFMASFTVLLTAQDGGQFWTLAFLIVVVSVDTGAYASGLAFGKHPMAPVISPKKTWEGFAGSVAAALIAGILLAIFMLQQPWWVGVILALVLVVTATTGDLAESLIKRDLGIKDISTWLPGHGGFLDRVDSSLLSGAAAYGLFLLFT
ncbi:CDP-archaeol synthase [Leifsonia sp. H3M29-4]|uniref:phosphatidate cytidylyltransferase n=1 Tax=Salinibacterium metalliresistens TaxID=3031321 RepID=UPI0023DBD7FB|nr:CDP-archaeol synthase [Salinibacterium metalliresistens]MDF1478676.1 CDP-archaeol synthase [Salinibacterium metalliresistens]